MAYTKTNVVKDSNITASLLNLIQTQYDCAMTDVQTLLASINTSGMTCVSGLYSGTGSAVVRTIELGFKPKFVILMCDRNGSNYYYGLGMANQNTSVAFGSDISSARDTSLSFAISDTGFKVTYYFNVNTTSSGANNYYYFAFM